MSKELIRDEAIKAIKYDEDSSLITLDGKEIGQWNDNASCDYPEDLIWRRDISGLFLQSFRSGYDEGYKAAESQLKQERDEYKAALKKCLVVIDCVGAGYLEAEYTAGFEDAYDGGKQTLKKFSKE